MVEDIPDEDTMVKAHLREAVGGQRSTAHRGQADKQ